MSSHNVLLVEEAVAYVFYNIYVIQTYTNEAHQQCGSRIVKRGLEN